MMTLWCMMRSPLMIGGELTKNDPFTLSLLTNKELLEMEKNTAASRPLCRDEKSCVWCAYRQDGNRYVAAFNLSEESQTIRVSPESLEATPRTAKELWTGRQSMDSVLEANLGPHDVALWAVEI
jgi:hypothetical protein